MTERPRVFNAGNAGPFTLDGTRTYVVGSDRVAIIDPGPELPEHLSALISAGEAAESVEVVLTHGHADHAAAAPALADRLGVGVVGPPGVPEVDTVIGDGDSVLTDAGPLVAVDTPGHAERHLCFVQPERGWLFAGDLFLGKGDTTWVAEYPGCVADYLASLARLRGLDLSVIFPAHGPPLEDPVEAIDRFEAHRRARIDQVVAVLADRGDADVETVLAAVYGADLSGGVRRAALRSLEALMEHVRDSRE